MKKLYSLIAATLLAISFAGAQCTVDTMAQTTPGVNPTKENIPCVIRGVAYNQTLQVKIQDYKDTTILIETVHIKVDSVRIDSVTGLPSGIVFNRYPVILLGGGNGCGTFTGTTNDPTGRYNLTAWGTAWLHATATTPFPIDTLYPYNGNLNDFSPFGGYYLDVVNTGTTCDHTALGVNDFSNTLNSIFSVYPNPSQGQFTVKLNAGSRVNGEISVVDVTGRKVFTQAIDLIGLYTTSVDLSSYAKGLYTVQIRTAEGFASKSVSIE